MFFPCHRVADQRRATVLAGLVAALFWVGPRANAEEKGPITKPGAVILDQDFAKPAANNTWRWGGGRWAVKDGVLIGSRGGADKKSAAMTYPFPCHDAVLTLSFQMADTAPLIVRFKNKKGDICGLLVFSNSIVVQKCEPIAAGGKKEKFIDLAKAPQKLEIGYWYDLTVKLRGEELSAAVAKGATVCARHPGIDSDKTDIGFIFSGGTGLLNKLKAVVPDN